MKNNKSNVQAERLAGQKLETPDSSETLEKPMSPDEQKSIGQFAPAPLLGDCNSPSLSWKEWVNCVCQKLDQLRQLQEG